MSDYKPRENDEKTVMEAHGLLPLGPLFENASRVVLRYGDLIQKHLGAFPVSVHKEKSFTVYSGTWFMQECIIPNRLKKNDLTCL